MIKKEIIDGNKLIDEFNEFYLKNLGFSDTELNYNTSWDHLMPVVEKIENDLEDSFNVDIVNNNQCEIVRNGNEFICGYGFETLFNSKIEAVYYSVVEFIKWYNSCEK